MATKKPGTKPATKKTGTKSAATRKTKDHKVAGGITVRTKTAAGKKPISAADKAKNKKAARENKAERKVAAAKAAKQPGYARKKYIQSAISRLTNGKAGGEYKGKKLKPEAAAKVASEMWKAHLSKKRKAAKDTKPKDTKLAAAPKDGKKPTGKRPGTKPTGKAPKTPPKVVTPAAGGKHTEKVANWKARVTEKTVAAEKALKGFEKAVPKIVRKRAKKSIEALKASLAAKLEKGIKKIEAKVEPTIKKLVNKKRIILKKAVIRVKKDKPKREGKVGDSLKPDTKLAAAPKDGKKPTGKRPGTKPAAPKAKGKRPITKPAKKA